MATALDPAAPRSTAPSLRAVAGPTYFPVAFIARLPFAMMVVGALTLVIAGRDSLAFAGLSSAMVGIGAAAIGPLIGAAADRFGQRSVVLAGGIANSVALLAMTSVVFSSLPAWTVLAVAFVVGATAPQVGPMSRSRLLALMRRVPADRRDRTLTSTMAYESAADETIFVIGPVFVGLLATTMGAAAPMIGAAILTAIFVTAFALHSTGRTAPSRTSGQASAAAPARELFRAPVLVLVAGVFGMGLVFGTTLTALSAFLGDRGQADSAGLLYGVMGVGSAVLALGSARLPVQFSVAARWLVFASILVLGAAIMAGAQSSTWLIVGLAVAGVGVGPTLVTNFSLGADRSPLGRSTTVMTSLGCGVVLGQSAASAINGAVAEAVGTSAAQAAPLLAALVVLTAGVVNAVLSARSRRGGR